MRRYALVVFGSLAALGSAQTVQLRYNPPVGTTRTYTMSMSMSMTMGAAGAKPMTFSQTSPMKIRVLSKTADTTTIETTTGPMKPGPGSTMPRMPQATKPIVVRTTMDRFGTPRSASGAAMPSAMMGSMGSSLQGVMLPKKPIRVGESWTQTVDMGKMMAKAMGPFQMKGVLPITYRLKSLSNGIATIDMTAKGSFSMVAAGRPIQSTMNVRSIILLETATGLTKSMTSTTDSSTLMPGMGAMRQHMTMTMK